MIDTAKENLCVNKLISEKTEIVFVEGDMIIPDSKPDVLNTISTSGIACIYKKELQDGKIRFDGSVQTYVMYVPEGMEEGVRGLNTTLDFSENMEMDGVTSDMQAVLKTNVKSVEAKVINDRKIGIKVALEVSVKVYAKDEKEVVNDVKDDDGMQILKTSLTVNSLLGIGTTKINAKDTVQIDTIDQLAEILKVSANITNKDIKINFNNGKSLTYDQIKGIVDGKNKQVKNSIRYEYYDQIHIHSTPSQKKPLLQGSNGKDFLQGNNENNRFEGKNGDDVYYFSGSIGKDVIYDAGGNDKIYLDESFYGKDILFTKENLDLRISFPKSNESILIKDFSKTTEKVTTHRVFRRKKEMFNFNRIETLQVGNDVSVDINALINHMSSFAMRVNNGNLSIADSLEKLNKMGSI